MAYANIAYEIRFNNLATLCLQAFVLCEYNCDYSAATLAAAATAVLLRHNVQLMLHNEAQRKRQR